MRQNAPRPRGVSFRFRGAHRLLHCARRPSQTSTGRHAMRTLVLALLSVGLFNYRNVGGQGNSTSVRGVWQAIQVTMTGPSARVITIPDPRPNLTIITAKHYSQLHVET